MALENREGGQYITILNGKFCQRVSETTPGAIQRVNKLGKTVFEKFYDNFVAKLVGIKTQDSPYGKNWVFDFQDKGEVYHLQLSYSNSFATAFLKMLPNIDVTKEMKLSPSVKEVDGKNKSSLFVNQDGNAIKHAYTKDAPNGMPDMEQITVKGQPVWDDTKRINFLYDMVQEKILPKLPKQESVPVTKEEKSLDEFTAELKGDAPIEDDPGF
jgi:hypothetical protein